MRLQLNARQQKNFWKKVNKTDTCWLWTGPLNDRGYGQFRVGKLMCRAHRVAYAAAVKIPSRDYVMNHLCYTRNCVNPAHLEAVTQYENLMYSDSPVKLNKIKTHCKRGHPLEGDNLYLKAGKHGYRRVCITCKNTYLREWRAEKRRKEKLNVEA